MPRIILLGIATVLLLGKSPTCVAQPIPPEVQAALLPGDINFDLKFDSADLVQALSAGKYFTGEPADWEQGDWNGDSRFDQQDLILAMMFGHYERGPYALIADGPVPSPRGGAPAIWVEFPDGVPRMVLFGGMDPITADTHAFTPATGWSELTNGVAPARRCHHSIVTGENGNGILFGGFSRQGRFNDTWSFDAATERWIELPTDGQLPTARCLHVAVRIPSTNEMLVYGGIVGSGAFGDQFLRDTSLLDLKTGTWTQATADSPPAGRAGSIAFYAPQDDGVYLWGGLQRRGSLQDFENIFAGYLTELWRFDPHERIWNVIETTGEIPLGREDATYFWDELTGRLYLFHGRGEQMASGSRLLDDAFVLDLAQRRWDRLEPAGEIPAPRWRASVAVDSTNGYGWMYGGWDDDGERDDMWRFDLQTHLWAKVSFPAN